MVSLEGSNPQSSGVMSNLTRFTLEVLVHGGAAVSSSRLRCCYSNTISCPSTACGNSLRQTSGAPLIAVGEWRYGSDAKGRRVSASFRHQTMNWGKPVAQLVSLDGSEALVLVYQWPGDFLDQGELKCLAPQDVGIILTTLNCLFPQSLGAVRV